MQPFWEKTAPILFLIILISVCSGPIFAESLSLEAFLAKVEEHAEDIRLAEQSCLLSDTYLAEARANILPSLSVSAGYQYNILKEQMFLDIPDYNNAVIDPITGALSMTEISQGFDVSKTHQFGISANLQQTLFSLQAIYGLSAARALQSMSREQYLAVRRQVFSESEKLYYQTVLLFKVFEFDCLEEEAAKENHRIASVKHDTGLMSDFDFYQSELRYQRSMAVRLESWNQYLYALDNLKRVGGLEAGDDIELDTAVVTADVVPVSGGYLLNDVISRRHDILAMSYNQRYLEKCRRMEQSGAVPYLGTEINYRFINQWDDFDDRDDPMHPLSVGFELKWDLLSGGRRRAKVRQAEIELEKARISTAQTVNDTRITLENLVHSLELQIKQIDVAIETLDIAERALSLGEVNAASGLISQQELKDAVLEHRQAQLNYWQKIYEYHLLEIDWKLTKGDSYED